MKKIMITGTGRSGTTFLMIIYTKLEFDTGFNDINACIYKNCNSGMEGSSRTNRKVVKNPKFMFSIDDSVRIFNPDFIVIPERNIEEVAKSREKHKFGNGGFVFAQNYKRQLELYNNTIPIFKTKLEKMGINTIFIDFYQMIMSPQYLYEKLTPTFHREINFEEFLEAYTFASKHQNRR